MLNKQHSFEGVDDDALLGSASSLVDILRLRAERQTQCTAYTFLGHGEYPTKSLTYGELDLQARQLAVQLQALGMPGERAILLYPPGLDYIVAFFACLYAGTIAVSAYPPTNGRHMPRLQVIIDDSQAAVILSTQSVANAVRQFAGGSAELLDRRWLITDDFDTVDSSAWRLPTLHKHDPAFLQYTSGSTGNAKGVIISHGNLMANQQLIKRRFGHNEQSTVVGWLPLYHDMGLIGNVMQPLYCGASAVLMSPMAFLEKPLRWLQAISDYCAHTSGGPNFAFELCTTKITNEEKVGLDLSNWRLAFNGAEPVNSKTLDRFAAAFAECGFSRKAFYPCYGLAEATLLATGGDKNIEPTVAAFYKAGLEQGSVRPAIDGDKLSRSLVGCGAIDANFGQQIRIVDPETNKLCGDDQIGEIQLGGPSISIGYWQNSAATKQVFISDADGQNRWLRTGDLGFIERGELFVSGRLKDMIIIRGRNYYPHDLEYAIEEATDALNPGCAVAFAVNGGDGEKLVVLAELKRNRLRQLDYRAEFTLMRTRLVEECGIQADTIMLLKPGSILKTSSGKIRRSACRQAFEQQQLKIVAVDGLNGKNRVLGSESGDRKPVQARQALLSVADAEGSSLLAQALAGKAAALSGLAIEAIDSSQSLSSLGLDSLKAVELKYFIDELLAIDLPVVQLLGNHSLATCAEQALKLAKSGGGQIIPVMAAEEINGEQPLSFGQQALWTVNCIEAGSSLYNMPVAIHIHAKLDKIVLHDVLAALFERHAQLRSGFRLSEHTRPVRIPMVKTKPRLISVNCFDEEQRSKNITVFVCKPFDLEHDSLLKAALFSCADDDHVLVFCAHHIVVDFRSLLILLEEIKALYQGLVAGHDPELPKVVANYGDYVAWQSAYLMGDQAGQDWQYWRDQLSGDLPKLALLTGRETLASPSCRGRAETLNIAPDILQKLKRLAAEQHTTLYTLLLTVFKILLYRYSGQQDIIVGSPTLGRPKREFADTVGYFVNPVALRSHPVAEQYFSDYLAEVNAIVLDAQAHQNYPFSLLVEKLQPEREHGASAFYSVWFGLQSGARTIYDAAELALGIPGIALDWAGLSAESYELDDVAVQFDMTLLMAETKQGLAASFQYRSDLLSHAMVLKFIGHYQQLLHGILSKPDSRLSELPLLSMFEYKQLAEWNSTGIDHPHGTLHSIFEDVVRQQSQAIALVYQQRRLSYAELNAQANRLAHCLLAQGAGPEKRVALCIQRCPEMVIGILAILKAGAVYIPIDPAYPKDRQTYLLQDAGCEWLLTSTALLPSLDCGDMATMCVDGVDDYANYSSDNPEIPLDENHAAYVIYTSGSTGNPKGVVVSHGNLMHSTWARDTYYKEPVSCYLLLSSFAFDSSVAGLFWTLEQGGCLCLPEDDQIKDPAALADLIARHQVTHLLALPSFYGLLLNQAGVQLQTLKVAIVAGETCSTELVKQHCAMLPQVRLYNEYGPTEATVWSSVYQATQDDLDRSLAIGRPISNCRLYILDSTGNLVPIGVQGELHIGGEGVARGYWQRPELTAENFIPDPFKQNGGRLYKTGDLARYRPDGAIEFLGRIDHQVKVRGFRIELGEIEVRLLEISGIKEAVVIAREDQPGDKRLVAYLVAATEPAVNTAELISTKSSSEGEGERNLKSTVSIINLDQLKARLKEALPDYMIPTAFVMLDSMPLSANSKLDRKRLPQPDMSGMSAQHYQEPQTPVERILVDIWRELLAVKRVGRQDNFFELGGDSILSIQVVSRARQAGVVITPKQLFQNQTISTLAVAAEQIQHLSAEQGLVSGIVILTPIQQWFFEQNLSNPHHWNQSLLLEVKPGLTSNIVEAALKQLLNHHDALRMRFSQQGGGWQQYLSEDESQAVFARIDLSDVALERQSEILESAASVQQALLHLSVGPLMRVVWFNLGEGRGDRVLIAIHHLIVDGVSWRILLEDLASVCRQLMSGRTPALSAKTSSFKYWSEQLVNQTGASDLAFDTSYWLSLSRKTVPVFLVDEPTGSNQFATEDEVTVILSKVETRALLLDAPAAYRTTIDELLLTALTLTLRDWMHCESVLIDLEGHGREDIASDVDVSHTVGWFTSVYPMLLNISSDSFLGDALKSVKEQLRAVPMKGLNYGLLRYLSPDSEIKAQLSAQPKAQIIFNYLGQIDNAMAADAPFILTREAVGANCDPADIRAHEFAIIGSIADGRMQLSWRYSRERYRKVTITTLSEHYMQHLKALIAHCLLPDSGSYTPVDFPLIALAQFDLDALALKPRQIEDVYPLAPLQYGLMFHSLYAAESSVYCIQIGCRLQGELNVPAFKQVWQQLVEYHPILRTRFHFENQDQPLQIVQRNVQLPITEYDWCAYPVQEQGQRWQQLQADDQMHGFDFTRAPLMRLSLVQCSDQTYYFLWSYHHILLDGWSGPLLIKELFSAYETIQRGNATLSPTVRPYRDYIAWLQNQDMAAAEAYWRSALSGFTAPTPLLADNPADNTGQHPVSDYAKHGLTLSAEQTDTLLVFAKQQHLTLNTLVQGAWGLLLSRYSGETDIVFGTTVSGRPAELIGVESMVGLFINSLPLRLKITPDSIVLGWLQALFTQNQDMRSYEYTPLTQVQGWSEVPRGTPLFESLLVFENYPINQALAEHADGLTVDEISVIDQTNYRLTISAFPGTELHLEITYATDEFEVKTVKRMLEHLQFLLAAFILQPQARLSELSLLSAADKQQILIDWNATEAAYPKDRYIHQLFEAQVEKTPDAVVVMFEQQRLSYAELNAKANQLAHYLSSKGVGPDVLVGIFLERSLEMVIGLLGIMKAGGAYVPLDPGYPQDRLDFILHDVDVPIVLSQETCREKIAAFTVTVLCLDSEWHKVASAGDANLNIPLRPENLAYCIYTSGSTGQPKGTGVPHQGILNRLQWMQQQYGLDQTDRILQKTPYSFDVSVWEFFWPLMTGAQLIIARSEEHKDSLALISTINHRQVTTIHFVPSMLQVFIDTPGVENCTSLKRVICSGEALPADLVQRFLQKLPAELHNLYGPTEASVDVSYWPCLPGSTETAIPIGWPIANIALYILDRQLNPVLAGTPGELHIGGIGLGRGYLNHPGLTAEKFIPNPYCSIGSRLYKTGDLARYRPDGTIDYLGRNDFQIKIRGFRIELGEIENRLCACIGVREAIVIARGDGHGDKRLVAYLTQDSGSELSIADLRADLAVALPDYMLPSAFVVLPVLPLTDNGKLDRSALPAPDADSVISHRYEAPQGAIEVALSCIWQELLELECVGRNDHFFELGGHSLMALTLVERLRREGWALEPRAVFANPILSALAAAIADNQSDSPTFEMPPNLIPEHFGYSLSNPVLEEFRL
ncbi:non-ribosomal peptide synthetase [Methylobacter sp. S3L5C]|uniref:non-ribosomal peptide synthetase n=1 Tax=Methylobacter sp. S3L5C TaxID=2839024 RepID=UPI001FAD4912|nr:non-ribosomal peptide synthetase [Methylobacter sp. S3L5C]UOA09649.1 amino acid adenylation domain-containing protein [Methylobacter sp. S3L5C]